MERYKNFIILVVILFGLGSGILIGINFGDPEINNQAEEFNLLELFEPVSNESFLIVGVNDIHGSSTELESLWLIEADFASSNIELQAIYPTEEFQSPHQPIMVSPAGPVEIFDLGFVSDGSVDHMIILDKAAFWTLIQLSDPDVELPIDHNQGTIFEDYPHVWEAPIQALDYQIGIISYLCNHSETFTSADRIEELVKLINNYLFTDLTIEQLLAYWQQLDDIDFNFTCEIK